MDIVEAKEELAHWRQLSFHIDKALDALENVSTPDVDQALQEIWKKAVEQEYQRLALMRQISPDIQMLAMEGEGFIYEMEQSVQELASPPWWMFWKTADSVAAHRVAKKTESFVVRLLNEGRSILEGCSSVNTDLPAVDLIAVQRSPRFFHHPELFRFVQELSAAKKKMEKEQHTEKRKLLELTYKQFADLLQQRDEFCLEDKLQAIASLRKNLLNI